MNSSTGPNSLQSGRLAGKVALITGAATGIGRATATLFAREGASLVLVDIELDAIGVLARELLAAGHKATGFEADVRDTSSIRNAVATAAKEYGRLDILFANAGIGSTSALTDATDEEWDRVMGVNGKGVFICCREAVTQMLAQSPPGGSIVINGSISGLAGIPGQGVYAPTKGAVVEMTRQLAVEYATRGIRVNCVCPGTVDTPILRKAMKQCGDPDGLLSMLVSGHPIGRIAQPEEIATAVLFLASDEASFVTGSILPVDGGYTAR
jgi:2-keto-3-deoxy-L-fuconate dehydrogenase